MEAAFAWLGQIIDWVGRWIPRLTIVNTTRGWVKFVRGKHVKSGGPGLVIHWPLLTELTVFPIVRDSLKCQAQTITLASGETVLVEAMVIYEVECIEKLVAYTAEPFMTIIDQTMGAVAAVIEGIQSWDELKQHSTRMPRYRDTELNQRLKEAVSKALEPYGVKVLSVMLQNKAKARVYKLVND
jgi:regulator of protease activity HflC (stomatin/prohibitin superfamily)